MKDGEFEQGRQTAVEALMVAQMKTGSDIGPTGSHFAQFVKKLLDTTWYLSQVVLVIGPLNPRSM